MAEAEAEATEATAGAESGEFRGAASLLVGCGSGWGAWAASGCGPGWGGTWGWQAEAPAPRGSGRGGGQAEAPAPRGSGQGGWQAEDSPPRRLVVNAVIVYNEGRSMHVPIDRS